MRVALYARISTRDKDQNPENQLVLLRREAERAGDTIIKEYVDEESGGKATRKQFQLLMKDASKRHFDLVRMFALDRFSSQGIEAVFGTYRRPRPIGSSLLELLRTDAEHDWPDGRPI